MISFKPTGMRIGISRWFHSCADLAITASILGAEQTDIYCPRLLAPSCFVTVESWFPVYGLRWVIAAAAKTKDDSAVISVWLLLRRVFAN